jgi:DNA-directed RNA polymerase specialized sigma24 family protein
VNTQESFDLLLAWLDPNREIAGRKYKIIHAGLVRIFVSRGFTDAEGLADETINRVIALLPEVKDEPAGERAPFFYKVARYIMLEARRRPEIATDVFPVMPTHENNAGDVSEYLSACLELLSEGKRDLILDYHLYKGRDKIEQHERMAKERGISVEALRSRAHHIRKFLKDCVRQRSRVLGRNEKPIGNHC